MNFPAKKNQLLIIASFAFGFGALPASAQTAATFGNVPLYFEADSTARFLARGSDAQFLISPDGAQLSLCKTDSIRSVQMQFAGANPQAQLSGDSELSGKINYLTGNNPAQWRPGVPIFSKVRVNEIYPGINLVYYGNQKQLEYDFTLAAGANPDAIAIHFSGADKISINAQGQLALKLGGDEIIQPKPLIYQTINGAQKEIGGGYKMMNAQTVAFAVENYDHSQPLVIDPVLSYSTYFGGNSGEAAWAVAVNPTDGSIYIAGQTFSKTFTNGVQFFKDGVQTNFQGGKLTGDAFVAKFDQFGTNLQYFTYLGGNADDAAFSLAVDDAGDAFVTGFTDSSNFPTANAIYPNIGGIYSKSFGFFPGDAFVTELNPGGSNLIYSTYLGGSSVDSANGIVLDKSGNAYVTGFTYSSNFPTADAIQNHLACTNSFYFNANAFVSEIAAGGTNLIFSTYLGGTNFDEANSIAVDTNGFIYVTGFTTSTNFPTTNYISQVIGANSYNGRLLNGSTNKLNSAYDAFVTKFYPSGAGLVYSTYLGGTNNDIANHIAVDDHGGAYVTGWTVSTNFPSTATNVIANYLTNNIRSAFVVTNAFLTKITNGISAGIDYSAVFGGNRGDVGFSVAVDSAGNAFVTGTAVSTNFPTWNTSGFLRATNAAGKTGTSDVFVTAFNTNASALLYSVYLGGRQNDYGYGIALDSLDNAYVVGQTFSTNFPAAGAFQSRRDGTNDAFLAEIILTPIPPEITMQPTNQLVEAGNSAAFVVTATGTPPLNYQWQLNGTNLVNGTNTVDGGFFSGTTNATLIISGAQTNDSGNYFVVITNYGGSVTSSVAVLTVTNFPPAITTQPTNQTVGLGSTVTFSINGFATKPYSFQWLKDETSLMNGTNVSGSTNVQLTLRNVQTNDDGNYQVILTNNWGAATSSVATLTVLTSPNFESITEANDGSNSFILNGVGGTNDGTYYVLASTNLATPLNLWTPVATNQFSSQGQFTFTNTPPADAPQQFYLLQTQSP